MCFSRRAGSLASLSGLLPSVELLTSCLAFQKQSSHQVSQMFPRTPIDSPSKTMIPCAAYVPVTIKELVHVSIISNHSQQPCEVGTIIIPFGPNKKTYLRSTRLLV